MHVRTDTAGAAPTALSAQRDLPDVIDVRVRQGWVALTGTAGWRFQRTAARNAVRHPRGVKGVIDQITLKPKPRETWASASKKNVRAPWTRTPRSAGNRASPVRRSVHHRPWRRRAFAFGFIDVCDGVKLRRDAAGTPRKPWGRRTQWLNPAARRPTGESFQRHCVSSYRLAAWSRVR